MELDVTKLDFDRCEDEPIHIPESIQSYGYLFALDQSEGRIKVVSENVCDLLAEPETILGRNFFELLNADKVDYDFLRETHQRAKTRGTRLPLRIEFKRTIIAPGQGIDYYAVVYDSDDSLVIELEPATKFRQSFSAKQSIKLYAISIAPKFREYTSLDQMAQEIVDTIRYITNMDRVVLYRFLDDGSGVVIAEAKAEEMDSYLHLHYPASDIPPQARELYKKNWVRLDPNVHLPSARLIPSMEESGRKPLDLTHSILRTLSPIHRQYVRNQGLKASMSMSLVTHDKLWGIISCHHREAIYIPQIVRLECENISQLFSWHLYAKEEDLLFQKKDRMDAAVDRMLEKVSAEEPIIDIFRKHEREVLDFMDADGFIFCMGSQVVSLGITPDSATADEINELGRNRQSDPFTSTDLSETVSNPEALRGLKGVLLIPLLGHRSYYTAWFRKEHRIIQKWVGAPDEKAATGSKRERLTPRSSFEVNTREIKGESRKWAQADIDVASRFNRIFMAYALELQERMRKEVEDLEKQDNNKNEFLATLAHELRNPLAPIRTGVAILEQVDCKETRDEVVSTIKRQVDNMTTMIEDLMDLSRVARGKISLRMSDLLLQDVLHEAAETSRNLFAEKDHELCLRLTPEPVYVRGDRMRLTQVFINILNNAAKYTDPGGRITVRMDCNATNACVRITDTGIGIPITEIGKIFAIFSQVDAHRSKAQGGLGIGLTLSQRLVEMLGGRITASSEGIGKGSEFKIVLPRGTKGPKAAEPFPTAATAALGAQRKVLIVDDNVDVTQMYSLLLEGVGFQTALANSPSEAIKLFPGFQPDFALLDIGLPEMDGFELCRKLAAMPGGEQTVFFSQSGWGSEEDIREAHAAGFRKHFVKPLSPPVLFEALRSHQDEKELHPD